ncbi:MAG: VOC family protein [Bacteroidetes bacterium]|nr:VOC family protein [Bacteroidota bacterium]
MKQQLALISILVNDYDEAIHYYTNQLHFTLKEDTKLTSDKRWVIVSPTGSEGTALLLAKASTETQKKQIGFQSGGRVFLFLHTDDIERDYQNLLKNKIEIVREKTVDPWGTVLVFKDKYGNLWDLIEPNVNYPSNK